MLIDDIRELIWENTNYTVFPQAIDVIDKKYDVDATTKSDVTAYHNLIESGNFVAAHQMLDNNPLLAQTIWKAIDYNRVRDAVIALERTFNTYIEQYIVNLVKSKGAWSDTRQYQKYDMVSYTGSDGAHMYVAMPSNETVIEIPIGTLPTDTEYWLKITWRGPQGEKGEKGAELSIRGIWNASDTYEINDVVAHNNNLWYAIEENIGEEPSSTSESWEFWGSFYRPEGGIPKDDLSQEVQKSLEQKATSYIVSYDVVPEFNSQNNAITLSGTFVDINGVTHNVTELKLGDNIYVIEAGVPNRWCSEEGATVTLKSSIGVFEATNAEIDAILNS